TLQLAHRLRRYRETIRQAPRPDEHRAVPGMDGALAEVIDGCLDLDPEKRYRDAGAVLDALDRREVWRRRRPLLWFGLLAPLLFLLLMGAGGWLMAQSALEKSQRALVEQLRRDEQVTANLAANVVYNSLRYRV